MGGSFFKFSDIKALCGGGGDLVVEVVSTSLNLKILDSNPVSCFYFSELEMDGSPILVSISTLVT